MSDRDFTLMKPFQTIYNIRVFNAAVIGVVVNNTSSLTLNFDVERQGCAAMKSIAMVQPSTMNKQQTERKR